MARIAQPENLMRAWLKVRRAYVHMDGLYDQGEVAVFDLELESNLRDIGSRLAAGEYRCDPLRFQPQPKKPDADGNPRMRESFLPTVRDEVAWMAVLNAIGPGLDARMPGWSYGNRLYRTVWFDGDRAPGSSRELLIGPYRHTTGHTYRRFKHSWPLFRRHLSLVARTVALRRPLREDEQEDTEKGAWLMGQSGHTRLPYFDGLGGDGEGTRLYHATFDLEDFYPRLTAANVMAGMSTSPALGDGVLRLLEGMLRFDVSHDYAGELFVFADEARRKVVPSAYDGVPTGLMVAGFLANVAMLPVDHDVDRKFIEDRDVAHFRYVDDHALLSRDFARLVDWIGWYSDRLQHHGIAAGIAAEKYEPENLGGALKGPAWSEEFEKARKACEIDGSKSITLTTRTLALVSVLAGVEPDVLADGPRTTHLDQLKYLLLANIPEAEIRGDTRASFAAGRIAMMTPGHHKVSRDLVEALRVRSRGDDTGLTGDSAEDDAARRRRDAELEGLRKSDREARQAMLVRHFELLVDAVRAHPDKPRLFQRALEYCRRTGHDGLGALAKLLSEGGSTPCHEARRRYMRALGNQLLARLMVDAAGSVGDRNMLDRQREAAQLFLANVADFGRDGFGLDDAAEFAASSRRALIASYAVAAARLVHAGRAARDRSLVAIARCLRGLALASSSASANGIAAWRAAIGATPLSWLHWGEMVSASDDRPPVWWNAALELADLSQAADRNAVRRHPGRVTPAILERIGPDLRDDDGGWLLDVERLSGLTAVQEEVRLPEGSLVDGGVSLYGWIDALRGASVHDPRLTEWTALTLVRRLLEQTIDPVQPLEVARRLHPANVRVPDAWADPEPDLIKRTWEGWKAVARDGERPTLRSEPVLDYRYSVEGASGTRLTEPLHAIGSLLWGLFRRDFALPSPWNIRGQERAVLRRLYADLESLPISSDSARFLRACLTPRGVENADPEVLSMIEQVADDTEFELRFETLADVRDELGRIVSVLESQQVTVMDHQPRQLVPVRLAEAAKAAVEEDADVAA
ncbi:RNA-directed DNA polymerase [Sphingomonas endophytica]|uniref:RNA-directed DNA polymerase n=1 Tax=Sphingomonas endophytica TaxID=869719 RepID=UPI00128FC7C7|nr:RNA-directed DNA polymerase [Sphingomonas endophytica]